MSVLWVVVLTVACTLLAVCSVLYLVAGLMFSGPGSAAVCAVCVGVAAAAVACAWVGDGGVFAVAVACAAGLCAALSGLTSLGVRQL